ncbi:MAG: DUF3299 domain-containing protein [Myxococcota bacterium]
MSFALLIFLTALGADSDKNAKTRAKAKTVEWSELGELDYETGKKPKALAKKLSGPVKIRGYGLPLEATGKGVSSFLLVSDPMFCAHVPPPPPNQLIMVELERPLPWRIFDQSVWLTGTLKIIDQKSQFGGFMYELKDLAGLEKGGW